MRSEKGPKYIYAQGHRQNFAIIITFEGIEEMNTEKMRHNARQSDNNICFDFDALFLFTRETIAECLSRYPARNFLV